MIQAYIFLWHLPLRRNPFICITIWHQKRLITIQNVHVFNIPIYLSCEILFLQPVKADTTTESTRARRNKSLIIVLSVGS